MKYRYPGPIEGTSVFAHVIVFIFFLISSAISYLQCFIFPTFLPELPSRGFPGRNLRRKYT